MSTEKIVEIFKIRKSPHLSPSHIDTYLEETQLRTGVSTDQLVQTILEVTKEKNYASVYPEIWNLNVPNIPREQLIDSYISESQWRHRLNDLIPVKKGGMIRVCSYNVHYFSPVLRSAGENLSNIEGVMEVVDIIQPDIIGFQEALLPYLMGDEDNIDSSKKHSGYKKDIQPRDPVIRSKQSIESEDDWKEEDLFKKFEERDYGYSSQCMASSTYSKEQTYFGNILLSKVPMERAEGLTLHRSSTGVGRCATFGYFSDFVVCNLHLDVFDGSGLTRMKEIKQVLNHLDTFSKDKPTILMGDFNSLKIDDYTEAEMGWLSKNNKGYPLDFQVTELLEKMGFYEVFGKGIFKYSVWSARRIDFIFIRNIDPSRVSYTGVMYTPASDHLPIFVDLDLS